MGRPVTHGSSHEAGAALIITVAVIAVVSTIATTAIGVVVTDLSDARRTDARAAARAGAESAADELFARVVRDARFFDSVGGNPPAYQSHPALAPNWAEMRGGAAVPCTDPFGDVCFQVHVTVDRQPGDPYASTATVTIQAVTLCPHGASAPGCVSDSARQRLLQRQFFDYLYFDDLETLDPLLYPDDASRSAAASSCAATASSRPSSCEPVPFLGPDEIFGPIHTNDEGFTTCLTPRFQPGVDRSGWPATKTISSDPTPLESAGATVFTRAPGPACAGSSPAESAPVTERPLTAPTSFALDVSDLTPIAAATDAYPSTTSITLHGDAATYSAERGAQPATAAGAQPWPARGVIVVQGDAYVSGTACEPVSIAATGDVYVDGDLTYGSPTSCPDVAIGLEADDAVVVLPTLGPSGAPITASADRTIEAAVLALGHHSCAAGAPSPPGARCQVTSGTQVRGGSFYVQGWDSAPAADPPHTLHFLGAIAAIWRGAIGGFDPQTGRLVTGWGKDFAFDRQLRTSQPPYFLQPVGAGWTRGDLTDVGAPS